MLPARSMRSLARYGLVAFFGPALIGGATGRFLLERMNRDAPALEAMRRRDESPRPQRSPMPPSSRLVIVVIDGLGERYFDHFTRDGTLRPVTWSRGFDTGTPSLSRPSYHAMFTGVSQEASAIRNNLHVGRARADTVMDRVRDAGGSVAWALETVDWMYGLAGLGGEDYVRSSASRDVDTLVRLAHSHTLTVVHWVTPDETAHSEGRDSAAYEREARACLDRASRLHDGLARAFGPSSFTLLVGADHGHIARGGHGGPERDVVETRWVRLGGPASNDIAGPRRLETALAATFTDALGIDAPRNATACPVSLAGVTSSADCATIERRRIALEATLTDLRAGAFQRARVRVVTFAIVSLAALAGLRNKPARREAARALLATTMLAFASAATFAALGPGLTLSAIRTQLAFVVHSTVTMFAGAAFAWPFARRLSGARSRHAAIATTLAPLAALVYTADRVGLAMLDIGGQLLAPSVGLFPPAACAAIALWAMIARRRSQQEPGGSRSPARTTVSP